MISIDSVLSVGPGEKLGELLESQEKTFQAQEKSWEKSLSARRKHKMDRINRFQLGFKCRMVRHGPWTRKKTFSELGEKLGEKLECQEKTENGQFLQILTRF